MLLEYELEVDLKKNQLQEISQQICSFTTNHNSAANHNFDDFKREMTHYHKKLIEKENIESHDLTPIIS